MLTSSPAQGSRDNVASITVRDQNNVITYSKEIPDIGVFWGDTATFDINLLPGQTEMRWDVAFVIPRSYPFPYTYGTVTNFSCGATEPTMDWITIDSVGNFGLYKLIESKLNIPAGSGCITHYALVDTTSWLLLPPVAIPSGNGAKSIILDSIPVTAGQSIYYNILLISNIDMPLPYDFDEIFNTNSISYGKYKYISKGRHFYKQSIAENSFGNAVQTYFSNNVLKINADLEPEKAENLILNIYNSVGTQVATETFELSGNSSFGYEIQNLQRGAYFFTLTTNSGEIVHRDKLMVTE